MFPRFHGPTLLRHGYEHAPAALIWPANRSAANVKLDKAGTYQLKLSIESPASKGWMLHVDPETGVKNHQFWTEPIEVTFDNWDYTPRQW